MLDVFKVDTRITLRHRSVICSARCSSATGGCGSLATPPNLPSVGIEPPAILSDPESLRNCLQLALRTGPGHPHRYAQHRSRPEVLIRTLPGCARREGGTVGRWPRDCFRSADAYRKFSTGPNGTAEAHLEIPMTHHFGRRRGG